MKSFHILVLMIHRALTGSRLDLRLMNRYGKSLAIHHTVRREGVHPKWNLALNPPKIVVAAAEEEDSFAFLQEASV